MKSPNLVDEINQDERREGVIVDQGEALNMDLEEDDVSRIIGSRISDAEKYWNTELNLDEARKRGDKYYVNEPYDDKDLYDFQVPYKNNRVITSIETLAPMATAQPAEPIVTEAQDTDESRQMAWDLQHVLMSMYRTMRIKAKLIKIVKHLLKGKRVGVLKYRFDPTMGRLKPDGTRVGKIVAEVVRPERIVFEQEASDPENIPLIAEYLDATIEQLTLRFPKKKDEIYKHFDIKRGIRSQIQKIVGYIEVWFTYYDKDGNEQEGVAWKLGDVILDYMQNPNWNYDEYETNKETGEFMALNFFERPQKPYILFNHLNDGKHVLDETSLMDNAIPMQDILNKRGRQTTENADQATSGMVLNAEMISQEDAAKLVGDPSEKIMVAGDVRAAASRLPANVLPEYVARDKQDARGEIDNIFGANAPIRGEKSGIKTLGQEVISQRANIGRLDSIATSIEDGMSLFYQAMVQMMKVFSDDKEVVRYQMSAGKTHFINWNRNKIEDGIQVEIREGSARSKDKEAIRQETVSMAGTLDPLSIAEGLDKENPKEWAKRIVYYHFFMDKYLQEVLDTGSDGIDPQALADIHAIMNGSQPPVPDTPKKDYLATIQMFLDSDGFKRIEDPQLKQQLIDFAKQVNEKAKVGIGESQPPTAPAGTPAEAPPETIDQAAGGQAAPQNPAQPGVQEPQGIAGRFFNGVKSMLGGLRK